MLVTTTNTVEGKKIAKYLGLVSGEAILGANIFKDFLPEFVILLVDVLLPMKKNYDEQKI